MTSEILDVQIVTRPLRVLVVDDVDFDRLWIESVLRVMPRIQVTGSTASIWEARSSVLKNRPDLVLLDEWVPGESPRDWVRELVCDRIPWVWLSGRDGEQAAPPPDRPTGEPGLAWIRKPRSGDGSDERRAVAEITAVLDSLWIPLNG